MDDLSDPKTSEDTVEDNDSFDPEEHKMSFHIGSPPYTHHHEITARRYVRTQHELDEHYSKPAQPKPTVRTRLRRWFCCPKEKVEKYFSTLFPIVNVLRTYNLSYILNDMVSGITIGCLSFPLGIAFGVLASLAPEYGLYSSFSPVILYLLFGTSRHISFGTNGIISLFTSELIHKHLPAAAGPNSTKPEDDIDLKSSIASGSTCIIGLILLLMGLFRLGFIVNYISSSFVSGFTAAGGVHIVTSMLPNALGITIPRFTGAGQLVLTYKAIFEKVPEIHVASLLTSLLTAAILLAFKDIINVKFRHKLKTPVPIDFIVVIIATIISNFANLSDSFGLKIVGDIPAGFPPPRMPYFSVDLVLDSFVVAIMIFMLSVSMSRLCEAAHNYRVNDNQELVAYGLSNFVSSFFLCFPSCAGPARTITLCLMGPKSTLHGLISSFFILIILLWIGPLFRMLPISVLSTMVIIAVKNLVTQMKDLPEMWRLNRYDFLIAVGTNLSGCFIDFPYALYVGVILCMFTVVLQSQIPEVYLLSKLTTEDRFLNSKLYDHILTHPRIQIFKFESSLYFATAEAFRKKLFELTDGKFNLHSKFTKSQQSYVVADPSGSKHNMEHMNRESVESFTRLPWDGLHDKSLHNKDYVIIDCSSINYIDINGLRILIEVICELENVGVTVVFASCNQYVRRFFKKSQLASKISEEHIFADIWDAFSALIM
ncbi:unnamed protein product [Mytilus coruscus]|uniref:STAS domain-containing protein n=1 Tax=Mytilus coruscus TaxID=42192 RepID=A0A6J8ANK0_MYTCO|nr:unnamed protein product [Mytilus coruscus]